MNNKKEKKVKCVVWDLDNTLWQGTLLEGDKIILSPEMQEIIRTLDERGILQSVASKNEYHTAMAKLTEFGLQDYFLYPQINWNSKSHSIETIAKSINIGIDTLAFIDDQPFEREEVNFSFPEVLCIDAEDISTLLTLPAMNPRFITEDSKHRRQMYLSDIKRNQLEESFTGPKDSFLASLDMIFTIAPAKESDLQRAEELTVRTNQLNTTGYTYSYEELKSFINSECYLLLITSLEDKYGTYGKIGLTLIERQPAVWTIKLLLMSCRVMSRGVGSILINHLRNEARRHQVKLQAELIQNDRNRMMYMTYKFAHFQEISNNGHIILFENDLNAIQQFPEFVKVNILTE